MSSAIFVDTFTRNLRVSVVSVTQTLTGLVIRFGAEVGGLWDLTSRDQGGRFTTDLPVLVAHRGYKAMSSYGHVTVLGGDALPKNRVVGIQGMPWMKGKKSLRPSKPIEVSVFAGAKFFPVETHARRGEIPRVGYRHWHSNSASAEAATAALGIRAQLRPGSLFIQEGQSDYVRGWEIIPTSTEVPEFPAEHRGEIFVNPAETPATE